MKKKPPLSELLGDLRLHNHHPKSADAAPGDPSVHLRLGDAGPRVVKPIAERRGLSQVSTKGGRQVPLT